MIFNTIAGALLLFSSATFGGERFVLFSTEPGDELSSELRALLVKWHQSASVSQIELFESTSKEKAQFHLFGILGFSDEQALQTWKETDAQALPHPVQITEVELLAKLGSSPHSSQGSEFVVMQYDVLVDRAQFEDYIQGYQLPEMVVRRENGGLVRYASYYARPGSNAPWQSLIIMEYKNYQAFQESKTVNKKLGEQLAAENARFRKFKQTKNSIRKKTATTRAHWVQLPVPTPIE